MPSSEALLDRLGDARSADQAGDPAFASGFRGGNRIISADRLEGFAPFPMDELSRDDAAPAPDRRAFVAASPAQGTARESAAARFENFETGAGTDPVGRERFEAGYRAGREAGFAEALARGDAASLEEAHRRRREAEQQAGAALAKRIESLHGALGTAFAQVEREAADQVVALALEVARHALRATLAIRPESIVPVVQEALSSLFDERVRVHLHLNPRDVELVRGELGERLGAGNCEIVSDASIESGGCWAQTPHAEIDATVATRWRRTLAAIGRDDDGTLSEPAQAQA